jgi:3-isopropylmalate dehydrogenase
LTKYKIALIRGDGIGPEISKAALKVLGAVEHRFALHFDIREAPAGDDRLKRTGEALPRDTIRRIRGADACLKGPVGNTAADVIVKLRQILELYANVRPSRNLPGVASLRPDIDFVIVRENTEDLYRGMEFEVEGGVIALRLTTARAAARIAEYAFRLAEQRNKFRKVVAVHKANVLRMGDGLFAQVCRTVARKYRNVSMSEMLVDAAAMNLIRMPETFDVIVTTNLYGDILSDEAAQLVGGLGLAPSANIGDKFAVFEPVHGSAPDIAGKGIADPIAMVLSLAMMLEWLASTRGDEDCERAAATIRDGVNSVLEKGVRTPDLGGNSTTLKVGAAIATWIAKTT